MISLIVPIWGKSSARIWSRGHGNFRFLLTINIAETGGGDKPGSDPVIPEARLSLTPEVCSSWIALPFPLPCPHLPEFQSVPGALRIICGYWIMDVPENSICRRNRNFPHTAPARSGAPSCTPAVYPTGHPKSHYLPLDHFSQERWHVRIAVWQAFFAIFDLKICSSRPIKLQTAANIVHQNGVRADLVSKTSSYWSWRMCPNSYNACKLPLESTDLHGLLIFNFFCVLERALFAP